LAAFFITPEPPHFVQGRCSSFAPNRTGFMPASFPVPSHSGHFTSSDLVSVVTVASSDLAVALDHENRKTPISKPAANAQRPNVQAETRRTRLRRSCGISWDRSVIAAAPPFAAIDGAILYGRTPSRRPGHAFKLSPNSGPVCPASDIGVARFAGLVCIFEWPISASTQK
jgi:hypothetical protein